MASIRLTPSKGIACPICGGPNCLWLVDRNAVVCLRVQDGCAKRRNGTPIVAAKGMGWLHRIGPDAIDKAKANGMQITQEVRKLTPAELRAIIKQHQSALTTKRLNRVAESLGVSVNALKAYGVGYDARTGAHSFPMYDGDEKLCGIRLRHDDGHKLAVPGSRNGLFISDSFNPSPVLIADEQAALLILTPEGPTDCCAAYDLGLPAIGRPSNMGGVVYLRRLLSRHPKQDVVIVADHDDTKYLKDGTPHWPGWEGALDLADAILPACGRLRVIKPPDKKKDLRKFWNEGGLPAMLIELIKNTDFVTPMWLAQKFQQVKEYKVKLKRRAA